MSTLLLTYPVQPPNHRQSIFAPNAKGKLNKVTKLQIPSLWKGPLQKHLINVPYVGLTSGFQCQPTLPTPTLEEHC